MNNKILATFLVALFIAGAMMPMIEGGNAKAIKVRKFIEKREIIPILTSEGLKFVARGKPPGVGKDKAPSVTITSPNDGATVSGVVTITVTVSDKENDPDPTPLIYIDGVYVATGNSYDWDTTGVSDGSHTITAEATDSAGNTGSDSITVTVNNGGGGGDGDGVVRKWALCIGVSDYAGTANDLNYCDEDARDWANFLTSKGYHVVTLLDMQATADNIEAKINELLSNEDADDYVVFTYSGHGAKYRNYGSCMISTDMVYITQNLMLLTPAIYTSHLMHVRLVISKELLRMAELEPSQAIEIIPMMEHQI